MIINYNSKNIEIPNVKKVSKLGEARGLMFRGKGKCPALLFEFNKPTKMKIHSFFVFFRFAAVWLDDKNKIIDLKIVKPFRLSVSCKKPFYNLIEIPLNSEYEKKVKILFDKN